MRISVPKEASYLLPWSPVELTRVNDHIVSVAKFHGEYPEGFHSHEFDELFIVQSGAITIRIEGGDDIHLKAGELVTVPKGVRHCPRSEGESIVLMIEPSS